MQILEILVVVQVPLVFTVQKPVEFLQVQFLDRFVEMLVCCATSGAHSLNCAETRGFRSCSSSTNSSTSLSLLSNGRCPWS